MTFLNPFVLIGLAAAGIPVLLHLLNLTKLKTIEFSSLRFIKQLQKTKIRRLKLKQILLLILRTLLIICIVLAFSRPTVQSVLPILGSHAKSSVIILLDNSFSMDVSDDRGNRFSQAKSTAHNILSALKDGDEAFVLPLAEISSGRRLAWSRNVAQLKDEVNALPIRYQSANLASAMNVVSSLVDEAHNLNREIYIISDMQSSLLAKETLDSSKFQVNPSAVFVCSIGRENVAVESLSVDSVNVVSRIIQIGKPIEVEAFVRNGGAKDVAGVVVSMMFNGQRVSQRSIDVPSKATRSVILASTSSGHNQQGGVSTESSTGLLKGSIEIEGDALDADNKRYFGVVIPPSPNILVIGSQENTSLIALILSLGAAPAHTQVVDPFAVSGVNLDDFDAVILAEPSRVSPADIVRAKKFVDGGGGILFFADDGEYQHVTQEFLFGQYQLQSYREENGTGFSRQEKDHPVFRGVFRADAEKSDVESPRIEQAKTVSGGIAILSIPGGAFLAESKLGEGKILYCAVPPTKKWSSLVSTGLFPTMIARSAGYLASREAVGVDVMVGDPINIRLPRKFSGAGSVVINDGNGMSSSRSTAMFPSGRIVSIDPPAVPGVLGILSQTGSPISTLAVNSPRGESILDRLSIREVTSVLESSLPPATPVIPIDDSRNIVESVAQARVGSELWKPFIILALLLALAELLVARVSATDTEST